MKLTPPKNITWFVALALAVRALLGFTNTISAPSPYDFWLSLASATLLVLACLVRGL